MNSDKILALGDELYSAMRRFEVVPPLTDRNSDITIDDAYQISLRMLNRRVELDGERVIGKKIGVTSAAVQEMLGVFQPDFGFLTDAMQYPNNAEVPVAGNLIQPRAEAEIAFVLKHDLGSDNIDEQAVLEATDCIVPCFEIVDSRIQDWNIKIQDTVADNASCGVFVLGDTRVDPKDYDLPNLKISVTKNGKPLSEGLGSAVQGNPLTAVAWLANTLGKFDIPFLAGDIILSGSLVPLEAASAGDEFQLDLEGVGTAGIKFV